MRLRDIISGFLCFALTIIVALLAMFGAAQLWEMNHPYEFDTSQYRNCTGFDCQGVYTDEEKYKAIDKEELKSQLPKALEDMAVMAKTHFEINPGGTWAYSSQMGNFKDPETGKEYGYELKVSTAPNYTKQFYPKRYAEKQKYGKKQPENTLELSSVVGFESQFYRNGREKHNSSCWSADYPVEK